MQTQCRYLFRCKDTKNNCKLKINAIIFARCLFFCFFANVKAQRRKVLGKLFSGQKISVYVIFFVYNLEMLKIFCTFAHMDSKIIQHEKA